MDIFRTQTWHSVFLSRLKTDQLGLLARARPSYHMPRGLGLSLSPIHILPTRRRHVTIYASRHDIDTASEEPKWLDVATWSVSCRRHDADMSVCLSFWRKKIHDTTPTFPTKPQSSYACFCMSPISWSMAIETEDHEFMVMVAIFVVWGGLYMESASERCTLPAYDATYVHFFYEK